MGEPQHQGTETQGWEFGGTTASGDRGLRGGSLGETTASGDRELRVGLGVGVWVKPQHQGTENSGWEFG